MSFNISLNYYMQYLTNRKKYILCIWICAFTLHLGKIAITKTTRCGLFNFNKSYILYWSKYTKINFFMCDTESERNIKWKRSQMKYLVVMWSTILYKNTIFFSSSINDNFTKYKHNIPFRAVVGFFFVCVYAFGHIFIRQGVSFSSLFLPIFFLFFY